MRTPAGKEVGALSDNQNQTGHGPLGATACAVATSLSCAPTVNVFGVYFPAWLVSAVVGLLSAYALVVWLGRRPGRRELAQSGLLFCSLTVAVSLLTWWIFFSGF